MDSNMDVSLRKMTHTLTSNDPHSVFSVTLDVKSPNFSRFLFQGPSCFDVLCSLEFFMEIVENYVLLLLGSGVQSFKA